MATTTKAAGYAVVIESPDMPPRHRHEIASDVGGSQYPIGGSLEAAKAMATACNGTPCEVVQEVDVNSWHRWPSDMQDAAFAILGRRGVDPHDAGAIANLDCDDDWAFLAADVAGYRIVWEQIPFIPPVTDYREGRMLLCKPLAAETV